MTSGTTFPSPHGRSDSGSIRGIREPWLVAAGVVVLLAAIWLRTGSGGVAALLLVACLVVAGLTWQAWAEARWRRVGFAVAATAFLAALGAYHHRLGRLDEDGEAVRAARVQAANARLVAAFNDQVVAARVLAAQALDVPREQIPAMDALAPLLPAGTERAVLVSRDGRLAAWRGRVLIPLDSVRGTEGVVATPFYLIAYVVASRGKDFAIATILVNAQPPADRLREALDGRVAHATRVTGFDYAEPEAAAVVPGAVVLRIGERPVLAAMASAAPVGELRVETWARALPLAGVSLAVMVTLLLAVAWRRDTGMTPRFLALGLTLALVAIVPFEAFRAIAPVFDPARFQVEAGWRLTSTAAALSAAATLVLVALLSLRRARVRFPNRWSAVLAVVLVAGVGPFLLRALADGVRVPTEGISLGLWVTWEVTIFLATVSVLLLGVTAGQGAMGRERGLPLWLAPVLGLLAAALAPPLLDGSGRLPQTYTVLWGATIVALAFTRRARAMVLPVALVAASGAVTLVWFSVTRERVALAVRDVQGLGSADVVAVAELQNFAKYLDPTRAARSRVELLSHVAHSALVETGLPIELATWAPDGALMAELAIGRAPGSSYGVNLFAADVQRARQPTITELDGDPGIHLLLGVPHEDRSVTTVVVAPRSRLVGPDPFGPFLGYSAPLTPEPPYALHLGEYSNAPPSLPTFRGGWEREGNELHGDWQVRNSGGLTRRLHATVDLRSLDVLVARGALLILLDLAVLALVWVALVAADGALPRWWRRNRREVLTSYRLRLTVALFACFLVPSLLFGFWSFRRLQADDIQTRDLLVRETLRGIATSTDSVQLAAAAARFETPLFLYANGVLVGTSDPLLDAIAPLGRTLQASVMRTLAEGNEVTAGRGTEVGATAVRMGYRAATDASGVRYVLAAPARVDDQLLDRRRNDLALFVLFALAIGAVAALWASGAASRQLSRPIRALRESALALARGEFNAPLRGDPPLEFQPVFRAFARMTTDIAEGRAELEAAERRLRATLRNVASGVIAVDERGRVTVRNPRAESVLGAPLEIGEPLPAEALNAFGRALHEFQAGDADDDGFETDLHGRRLNVRFARIAAGARRAVVTLDDVTDVVRAERVLAWGEMARQVAHEIKNPLTPMRLGLQHLRRARRDGRVDFDRVLDENTTRMLAEIDRLDEIARAFSRYGAAPTADAPAERVDVAAIARDVLELERMGETDVRWDADVAGAPVWAAGRDRELREVLLNVLENARQAKATTVSVRVVALPTPGGAEIVVSDDGTGIPTELLERVFEPQFSTRTSGSGLGLAISRRLIEGWGGAIRAEQRAAGGTPPGTVLRITLAAPPTDSTD